MPLTPSRRETQGSVGPQEMQHWTGQLKFTSNTSVVQNSENLHVFWHLLAKKHLQPGLLSKVPARWYGDYHHQKLMALDWAWAAQGCQLHHQSCNPTDPRGAAEVQSTEDNWRRTVEAEMRTLSHNWAPSRGWPVRDMVEEHPHCPVHLLVWWAVSK